MVSHGKSSPSTRAMSSRANSRAPAMVGPDGCLVDSDQENTNKPFLRSLGLSHSLTKEQKSLNAAIEAINQAALAEHIDLSKLASAGYVWDPSPARRKRFFKNYHNTLPFQDLKDLNIGLIKGSNLPKGPSSTSTSTTDHAQANQGAPAKSQLDEDSLSDPEDKTNGSVALKKKKKKKKKTASTDSSSSVETRPESTTPSSVTNQATTAMVGNPTNGDGIWNTSDAEERQRIRAFWFQLPERDRRTLVRLEKEAVMEKMKEQQRHACPCAVCGRKRSAIEDELEQLYDAYYDELEEYAHQLKDKPTKPFSSSNTTHHHAIEPEHDNDGGHAEDIDQDSHDSHDSHDGSDEEDGDDDVDGPGSGIRDVTTQLLPAYDAPNIAQATEGILDVAEDLLGNNGEKFLDMMDKLELEGRLDYTPRAQDSPSIEVVPVEEEEKCENEDALTKELRMEEGRKMFQAFAARMFEQRVLSAYREQIAEERRLKLLQELEEETRQEQLREERKEREKEKKREKKRIQKQQKEEEKAAKEAQRLAEEQRIAEERRRKSEAAQKRKEEERRVKEERIVREQEQQREEARKREVKAREDDYKVKVEEDAKEDAKALTVSDQKDPSPVTKVVEPTSIPSSQLSLSAGPSSPVSKPVVVGEAKAYVPTQVPVQSLESLWSQSFPSILSTPSSQHQTPSRHSPRPDFVPFQGGQHDCIHTQEYAGHIPTIGMSFHEPDFGMVDQEYQRDGALRESMFYPGSSVEYDQVLPPMSIPFSPHVPVFTNSPSLAARNVLAIGSARRTSVPGRGSDAYAPIERPLAMGPPNEYNDVASDNLKPTGPSSGFGELSIGFTEFVGDPTMDRRPRSLSVGLVEDIAVSSGQLYPQYQQYFQQQQQQPPYQQLYQEQPFQPFQHQDAFMPSQLDGFSGGHLMDRLSTLDFLMHDDDYQSSLFADSFFNRDKKGTLDPFGTPSYTGFLAQRNGSLPNVSLPSGQ